MSKPIISSWNSILLGDGYPHHRDEVGNCANCGASTMEPHYKLLAEDAGTKQRERMGAMTNPGAKQFQQVKITVEVWVDPELADTTAWAVADNVQITAVNAVEAAMKEIEAPDNGVEVVVKS